MRISDAVALLNRAPKILGVSLDTHFTFGPHAHDCFEQASRAFNVMKAFAGSSWGFTTETLVATYKAPTPRSFNRHLPAPPTLSKLPSRPHTTAPSEACESEVTTPTPLPSSSGTCWKRAPIPWPDASSEAG